MIDKQIIDVFANLIPKLSDLDKERLYSFAEGLAFRVEQQDENEHKSNQGQRGLMSNGTKK